MSLSDKDIESEISYTYLHAVTSQAGMECNVTARHSDGAGIDARIHALGHYGGPLTDITLEVQLKATIAEPTERDDSLSYPLRLKNYNDLRKETQCQRILVVLFLPRDSGDWLHQSEDELAIRRCAYWCSLRGALESENKTNQTVYLPKSQLMSPEALVQIVETNSKEEWLYHVA